jgi:hypothetical protein
MSSTIAGLPLCFGQLFTRLYSPPRARLNLKVQSTVERLVRRASR